MSDLDIISQLEKILNIELEKLDELLHDSRGFIFNQNKQVIGLSLYDCKIIKIEKIISPLKKLMSLTQLWFYKNQISDISPLKEIKGLTQLYLGGNQISDISSLKELKSLIQLELPHNKIGDISSLIELLGLTWLDLNYNQISDISPLKELKRLRRLTIIKNQISDIYPLKELKNLTILSLEDNQINDISPIKELYNRNNFLLFISGNPLIIPPVEIVQQSKEAIKNYFNQLEKQKSKLYEAKLLLVGQGAVGKTWLWNRIVTGKVPDEAVTTEGVDINKWMVDTAVSKEFRINIWDFGGQEIYHATHQFFLTKRSLYLLVWEARKDEDMIAFDYWLNVIKLLSDNAPVIVVMNKCDERSKAIEEKILQLRFKNIVSFHKVSARDGTGIADLIQMIKQQSAMLPHIGTELPTTWLDIRKELEDNPADCINHDEYRSICKKHGLDQKQAGFLSDYFHDLGVFLHFTDNPVLDNIVFLKPDWATNAVYRIIDTKDVRDNNGRFGFKQLQEIWKEYRQDKFHYLIELMKRFELCFQLGETQNYIIPELLQAEPKELHWNYKDNLCFEYHYEFMPAGIVTRFTVRNHQLIKGDTYWKYGVMLENGNTLALINSEPINRKIKIWVKGNEAKELLYLIRTDIDRIHETLNRPEVKEMIPCNCRQCMENPPSEFYEYQLLKERLEKGPKRTIECRKSGEDISIEVLLKGYEPSKNTVMLTQKEVEGYHELLDIIIDKKIFLEKELKRAYDGQKKYSLSMDIGELEKEIENLKKKISGDLKEISNNAVNIGSNSSGNIILQGISNSELNIEIKNGLVNLESKADELLNDVQKLK